MRLAITTWQQLTPNEQAALSALLGARDAEPRFDNAIGQAGRDTLLNMYYLMTSEKVAGNLWHRIGALRWAERNQLGIEVDSAAEFRAQLEASGNFRADSWLICYFKRSRWSLRQVHVEGARIADHGFQVYQPDDPSQPELLVADIDTIVFSKLRRWPRHALDILYPDPVLNDPLRARRALEARGIFPELCSV